MSRSARPLVSIEAVSEYLDIPIGTLRNWRTDNYGPPAYKVGKHLRYDMAEVRRWVRTQARAENPQVSDQPRYTLAAIEQLFEIAIESEMFDAHSDPVGALEAVSGAISCEHTEWEQYPDTEPGNLNLYWRCSACKASPAFVQLVDGTAELECGHVLTEAYEYEDLADHMGATNALGVCNYGDDRPECPEGYASCDCAAA